MSESKDKIVRELEERGLSIESVFIPFSKSRNKDKENMSLNWIVTLFKDGKKILSADYMAGIAHCPSNQHRATMYSHEAVIAECETGFQSSENFNLRRKDKPILPDFASFVYSILMDSEAFEYSFQDWCDNYGCDTDSIKAEKMYRECLDTARELYLALGTSEVEELHELFQDY